MFLVQRGCPVIQETSTHGRPRLKLGRSQGYRPPVRSVRAPLLLVLVSLLAGCGDDTAERGGEGAPCRSDSECSTEAQLSCVLPGDCNNGDGPCGGATHCRPGEDGLAECQPYGCDAAAPECPAGSTCVEDTCDQPPCSASCRPILETCASDAECPDRYACIASACREGCRGDADCDAGIEVCDAARECAPRSCAEDGDCGDGVCIGDLCRSGEGTCEAPAA